VNELFKLSELLLRKFSPAFGRRCAVAKSKKQFANFVEGETDLARALQSGEAIKSGIVVPSSPADALRTGQHADLFVIANRGRTQSDLPRDIRNSQEGHFRILG